MPLRILLTTLFTLLLTLSESHAIAQPAPLAPNRIVFLGDSITDGHTYPSLVAQALADAGKPTPIATNAGIGGDTAKGMTARLDRDVLRYKPDVMTLSAGINDVIRGVDPVDYAKDIETILDAVGKAHVEVIVLTTSTLGEKQAAADMRLAQFNAALLASAEKRRLRVAQVNQLMQQARKDGVKFMEVDDVHPNFEGQRIIARAVLDAMGHKDVPVPAKLKPVLLPGVISPWTMRPIDAKTEKPLNDETVKTIAADARENKTNAWKTFTLPEPGPNDNVWLEQERGRGFAVAAEKVLGKSTLYLGVATLKSPAEKTAYFNTGGQLKTLWVNGKKIYEHKDWHGWHAGRERLGTTLQAGDNTIVIETNNQFFLSVTDSDVW
jgi:lysophospholipase L1-like esterase